MSTSQSSSTFLRVRFSSNRSNSRSNVRQPLPSTSTVIANESALSQRSPVFLIRRAVLSRLSPHNSRDNRVQQTRQVKKSGWLQYNPNAKGNMPSILKYYFVIFVVENQQKPLLEIYAYQQSFGSKMSAPEKRFSLEDAMHVTNSISLGVSHRKEFVITLKTEVIRLITSDIHVHKEWMDVLNHTLIDLNIFGPQLNHYSLDPVGSSTQSSTLAIVSRPLPPIPVETENNPPTPPRRRAHVHTASQERLHETNTERTSQSTAFSFGQIEYEPIFNPLAHSHSYRPSQTNLSSLPSNNISYTADSNSNELSSNLRSLTIRNYSLNEGWAGSNSSFTSFSSIGRLSLRESQVIQLKSQIDRVHGMRFQFQANELRECIALVSWGAEVWVAGWKQRLFPDLHDVFYIGDQIISLDGVKVCSASHAMDILRKKTGQINVLIRRTPLGKIFLIKREFEGQDLGIKRDGNKAEIISIDPTGLAATHEIPSTCSMSLNSMQFNGNWWITEINMRPLNLFFKQNEIHDRLYAVGREISLLLQPADLIRQIRHHLKQLKNYKDFRVQ